MTELKQLTDALERNEKVILWYASTLRKDTDPNTLLEACKKLLGATYVIEKERIEAHKEHTNLIMANIKEGKSKAESEKIADLEVSSLYQYRRLLEHSYRTLDMMRTDISFIKHELNNTV